MKNLLKLLPLALIASFTISCSEDGLDGTNGKDGVDGKDGMDFTPPTSETIFENKSNLEPLVSIHSGFKNVKAYSLLSSSDVLSNGFTLLGAQDGAGLLKDPNSDGYIYLSNAEDDYSVSRTFFDRNMNPIKGDWLLNGEVADRARQCSATMWEKEIHGGTKDIFLSASESIAYDVKGIDPYVDTPTPTADFGLDALGEFSWENAVPLPKNAYAGKTVIIGGDDDSSGSQGQVVLYYSENGDQDLENGKIYVLRLKQYSEAGTTTVVNAGEIYNEGQLDFQKTYDVEFVEIVGGKDMTKNEMETACVAVQASAFMRVEDVDYQKGSDDNGRNVYFAVTGRGPDRGTYNDWGTAYKLELDAASPLKGKLTQVISGNTNTNNQDGNLATLQSPDNICVTENFIYLQEDPNSFTRGHAAYIYQSDLDGNNSKVVLELVVEQNLAEDGTTGLSGEFGALTDVSDKLGIPDTFLLNLQPHYWRNDDFVKGSAFPHNQGGQIVLLQNLPR
ncbi:hypothetical protein ACXGQW_01980 [Wenyingzhuangia sp. IMCC45533]